MVSIILHLLPIDNSREIGDEAGVRKGYIYVQLGTIWVHKGTFRYHINRKRQENVNRRLKRRRLIQNLRK